MNLEALRIMRDKIAGPPIREAGATIAPDGSLLVSRSDEGRSCTPQNKEMTQPKILGDKVWCPRCQAYVKILRVARAAKAVDVHRRSIYRYIEKNKIYAVQLAGGNYRVCTHCLLQQKAAEAEEQELEGQHR